MALTIARDGRRTTQRIERARVTQPVVAGRIVRRERQTLRRRRLHELHGGLGRPGARSGRAAAADAAPTGSCSTCAATAAGLLNEAVGVASIFIPDGTIVSTDGRSRARHVYTATGGAIRSSVPVVVLVDRGTASSAEIVTGALQDRHRAEVVGTNTYGKGVFQEIRELPNGGALDLTVGQYFLPSGRNIGGRGVAEGRGIAPDVRASDDPDTTRRDEALDAALAQLAAESR